jgi:membrane protein implicated in regulation of membrane protease activity
MKLKPATGRESLPGRMGIVYSDLSPDGEVKVDGIIWKSRLVDPSTGPLKKGEAVIVDKVNGITLFVEHMTQKERMENA